MGIGLLNTGEVVKGEGDLNHFFIESTKFIQNVNILYVPVGVKIKFGSLYILPEVGVGFTISNKTIYEVNYSNGKTEKSSWEDISNPEESNKISIPVSLSFGKDIKMGNQAVSIGFKGYYSFNQALIHVPRKIYYFAIGLVLAVNL